MHSTSIFFITFGLLVAVAMARPWSGHHHGKPDNEEFQGHNGYKWSAYRLPSHIRLPQLLAGKLGQPSPTFTAKKIFDGKYLLISPALIFKLKELNNDTEVSTTAVPESSTTDEPEVVETTTVAIDEDTTTVAIDEDTTTDPELEESTTAVPSFFKRRSFPVDDDEQLLFLDD